MINKYIGEHCQAVNIGTIKWGLSPSAQWRAGCPQSTPLTAFSHIQDALKRPDIFRNLHIKSNNCRTTKEFALTPITPIPETNFRNIYFFNCYFLLIIIRDNKLSRNTYFIPSISIITHT